MRSLLKPAAGFTCLFALATAGCSAGPDGIADSAPGPSGRASAPAAESADGFAPYVGATGSSENDSAGSPATYNLAFVLSSGSGCAPMWNGTQAIGDPAVKTRISQLKANGADVRVSFGGAAGKELASDCDSAAALAAAYGEALDAAGTSKADFDVEGGQLSDAGSIALRSQAIAKLQQDRPGLEVTFTLPVMPSGLDDRGLAVLRSANEHDVQVSTVNLMTMNYGASYTGDMGDYALAAAEAAHAQLKEVFKLSDAAAWQGMALTSMIGVNDVAGETFTLADAAQVRSFAEEKKIAWVSMWSTFRDQQCPGDAAASGKAATDCSGVKQSSGAFGRAFAG
ncbi:chitinase [Streptomyces sp. NPDC000987]|uniref:chitinase n=1 Tax=Streptomyces sp. NPDC000987 TaxID=3154374 RepID=UPI00332196D3